MRIEEMGHRIIFATGNEGKMREIRVLLADLGLPVLSMKEAGAEPEIVEDGATFGENAEIKARAVWNLTGDIVLADDSGLVVDHLGGEPGIYSARYMGEDTSYEIKNRNIIDRLKQVAGQERSARFVCNIAAVLPGGQVLHTEETMEGLIADEPAGQGGFGYDPILYLPAYGMTSAEISMEEKNKISHRGKALRAMKTALEEVLKKDGEDAG
jgi:XTP/dITP diphosphohydrolase